MLRIGRGSKPELPENRRDERTPPPSAASVPQPTSAVYATDAASPTAATGASPRATTEHENLARAIKDGTIGGFVGHTTALTGEVNFKAMLRVDGHLSGRVASETGTLVVGAGGQVDAEINVAVAKINGTVNGNINTSERLELGRAARVFGNIQTPELVIEQGAVFEGRCRMSQRAAAATTIQFSTDATRSAQPAMERANQELLLTRTGAQTGTADENGAQRMPATNAGIISNGDGQGARDNVTT